MALWETLTLAFVKAKLNVYITQVPFLLGATLSLISGAAEVHPCFSECRLQYSRKKKHVLSEIIVKRDKEDFSSIFK